MITLILDKVFYKEFEQNWDDKKFRDLILSHLRPTDTILDLGAGAGIVPEMNFKGCVQRVCGIDIDPRILENPYLDEAKLGRGETIPYPDSTFDIVFCDNVFEHLSSPKEVLIEVRRVLKSDGLFIAKTPNRYHYVALLARLTPLWFHKFFNRLRGRNSEDTFPTIYKINCKRDIEKFSQESGFKVQDISYIEGRPEYLRFFFLPYIFGIIYERIVNKFSFLNTYKVVLMCTLKK